MRRKKASTLLTDTGSASLEFIVGTFVLLVPLLYVAIALADVQNHALGADAAARQLSLTIARGGGEERAQTVMSSIAREYGMDEDRVHVRTSCAPAGDACPRAGAVLIVTVTATAPLPLMPAFLGDHAAVTATGTAAAKVSDYIEDDR